MSENNNSPRPPRDRGAMPGHHAHSPLTADRSAPTIPKFRVIPAGKAFYHVVETATNRVIGYRRRHIDACSLARQLEGNE